LLDGGAEPLFETSSGLRLRGRGAVAMPGAVRYAGVRPEDISLRLATSAESANSFPARIRSVLYRGWTREVVLTLDRGETIKAVELVPRAARSELPSEGSINVTWPPDACHFLEGD
jgi:hypothetical protein